MTTTELNDKLGLPANTPEAAALAVIAARTASPKPQADDECPTGWLSPVERSRSLGQVAATATRRLRD